MRSYARRSESRQDGVRVEGVMRQLSMALEAALVGAGEMTPELMGEWQAKRPDEYRVHKLRAIRSALSWLRADEVVSGRLVTKAPT